MHRNAMLVSSLALALSSAAIAHPGHTHDDQPTTDGVAGVAQPARPDRTTDNAAPAQLPEPEVTMTEEGAYRVIRSNGVPSHTPGAFPNRGNPNTISAQQYEWRVPLKPVVAPEISPMRGVFGVALDGIPFDPGTAEFWSANGLVRGRPPQGNPEESWNYDALGGAVELGLDESNAHVQPTGAYHYHAIPAALAKSEAAEAPAMTLLGWAGDGFPIYGPMCHEDAADTQSPLVEMTSSYQLKQGERPGAPDGPGGQHDGSFTRDWVYQEGSGVLDECNGRTGVTPEFPDGTYYYVLTESYPYIPRHFRGTPDASFIRRAMQVPGGPGGPGVPGGRDRPRGPRPPRGPGSR